METYRVSRKEAPRPGLLKAALSGRITNLEGARALRITVRQFQRLRARFRKEGAKGVMHQARGRPSGRGLPEAVRKRVVELILTTYLGLNDCHLTEKLREAEGISIARESVRQIRLSLKIVPQRRRRPAKHRSRRLREAREGALLLVDGSPHDWLEGRGPSMTLMGCADDATGAILALHFCATEDFHGYLTIFEQVFTRFGLPLAIYGDGTSILVRNDRYWTLEEELQGAQNPTHLGRILQDLGIRYIRARSPQAKGRIENRWSTLQDRLVAELRLRGICTQEQANAYLPEFLADFNRRFAKDPRETSPAWRPVPHNLGLILSCRYQRRVARDNTVTLRASHTRNSQGEPHLPIRWIQIPAGPRKRSYAGCRVQVCELSNGQVAVLYNGTLIALQPTPKGDFRLTPRETSLDRPTLRSISKMSPNAPIKTTAKPTPKTKPRTKRVVPNEHWRHGLPRYKRVPKLTLEGVTFSSGS